MAVAAARGALTQTAASLATLGDSALVSDIKSRMAKIETRLAVSPEPAIEERIREH
jgi:hypothetical protein